MDEIFKQLTDLYGEADKLLDAYVERVCTNAGIPRDIIRNHTRKLESA
jgi:GTP-sensing pleiotropic transcriptional regulator CodY